MPRFSVVIPLYNKGPHLRRTLDSVFAQTIQDFEIIIIDGGSTDEGPDVVKCLKESRINFFRQENTGVSAARNQGIQEAKADLIVLLDADDEWKPTFLEIILKLINKYPEAGAYATSYNICESDGKIRSAKHRAIPKSSSECILHNYFEAVAIGEHPVFTSAVCIPKRIFFEIGGFQVGAWWGEDDDLWGRIALRYPIAFSWQIGATYHRDAINRTCNFTRHVEEHPFVRTAREFIQNKQIKTDDLINLNECIARYQITSAVHNIYTGNPKNAKKNLKYCNTKLFYYEKLYWRFWSLMPPFTFYYVSKIFNSVKTFLNHLT